MSLKKIIQKKVKAKIVKFYNNGSYNFIRELQRRKETFTASHTGYTCSVLVPRLNVNYFFSKGNNSKKSMFLCSKIKSEIKKSKIYVDNVRSAHVKYFQCNTLDVCEYDEVYNVDITNCYPTTLFKLGFITEALFKEMEGIDKMTRLKAIGQIATRKSVYSYLEGVVSNLEVKEDSHLRNVWFTICHETGESIYECQKSINSFLFFWFDGIYFKDKSEANKIIDILERRGYKSKFEVLNNFKVSKDDKNIFIGYNKENKRKNFTLPLENKINYN